MTEVFEDYMRLAKGQNLEPLAENLLDAYDLASPWWDHRREVREIAKTGLTRTRLMNGCVPKPTVIQNLVYCTELKKWHGNLSQVEGFNAKGNFILPTGYGVIYPVKQGSEIVKLGFITFGYLMRHRELAE